MSKKPLTKEVDLIAELEAALSESISKEEPPTDVKEPTKPLPFWQQNVVVEAPIWLPK